MICSWSCPLRVTASTHSVSRWTNLGDGLGNLNGSAYEDHVKSIVYRELREDFLSAIIANMTP
jgi:hypothetical protein